jgi:hypothetical protein
MSGAKLRSESGVREVEVSACERQEYPPSERLTDLKISAYPAIAGTQITCSQGLTGAAEKR